MITSRMLEIPIYRPGEFVEAKESSSLSLLDNMIRIYKGETP
jgi:hypothetical protein